MRRLLVILLIGFGAVASAQERVEFMLDAEGVHRNSRYLDPEDLGARWQPRFENGGGVGGGVNVFFSRQVSLELKVAALGTHLRLREQGSDYVTNVDAGWTQVYPIMALLQWHPIDGGWLRPYIGAGVAHIIVKDLDASNTLPNAKFDNPTGLVLNAGLSVPVSDRLRAYGDVRYVPVETESSVQFDGDPPARMEVHPLILAVGLAYRF